MELIKDNVLFDIRRTQEEEENAKQNERRWEEGASYILSVHFNGIVTDAVRDVTKHGALKCHPEKKKHVPTYGSWFYFLTASTESDSW